MSRARDNADLGDSYGSLGAGVTGGSGLNALGTVTSGNLSNDDIVYPVGHVLQVRQYYDPRSITVTTVGFGTDVSASFLFTPKKASSNILLTANFTASLSTGGPFIYCSFYKNASDFTATHNLGGYASGLAIVQSTPWTSISYSYLDPVSENSVSEKTYAISTSLNATGTGYLGWGTSMPITLTVMEIAT